MAMDDETRLRERVRAPSKIAEMLKYPERQAEPPEAETGTEDGGGEKAGGGPESFDPEGKDYKAYGRAGNKTVPSLRLIFKDGSELAVVYAHLDSHPEGGSRFIPSLPGKGGSVIWLRVAGQAGAFMIEIEGLRLRQAWEMIQAHRTPWIFELPAAADFRGDKNEPVITAIRPGKVLAEGK